MKRITELAEEYIAWQALVRGGRPARDGLAYTVRKLAWWLEKVGEVRSADQLTPGMIRRWLQHQTTRLGVHTGRPLSAGTLQTRNRTLTVFCYWLHDRGYVPVTVPQSFPKPRRLPIIVKPALSHAQMRRLLRWIPCDTAIGIRNRALGEFFYTSGVRIAEALDLDLDDLDLDNGTACIQGKGNKDRVVPIGKQATHCLQRYLVSVRPLLASSPREPAVWLGHKGKRLSYDCYYRQWRRLMNGMALPIKVRAHTFRRSCATELHRNGASPWTIKELLGHKELETLRYYLDLRIEDLKRTHARCHPRDLST